MEHEDSVEIMLSELVGEQVDKDGAVFDIFAVDEDVDCYSFYAVRLMDGDHLSLTYTEDETNLVAEVTPERAM